MGSFHDPSILNTAGIRLRASLASAKQAAVFIFGMSITWRWNIGFDSALEFGLDWG